MYGTERSSIDQRIPPWKKRMTQVIAGIALLSLFESDSPRLPKPSELSVVTQLAHETTQEKNTDPIFRAATVRISDDKGEFGGAALIRDKDDSLRLLTSGHVARLLVGGGAVEVPGVGSWRADEAELLSSGSLDTTLIGLPVDMEDLLNEAEKAGEIKPLRKRDGAEVNTGSMIAVPNPKSGGWRVVAVRQPEQSNHDMLVLRPVDSGLGETTGQFCVGDSGLPGFTLARDNDGNPVIDDQPVVVIQGAQVDRVDDYGCASTGVLASRA